jgi:hypothetical protein
MEPGFGQSISSSISANILRCSSDVCAELGESGGEPPDVAEDVLVLFSSACGDGTAVGDAMSTAGCSGGVAIG